MGYKQIKVKYETYELVEKCIEDYLDHHPEMLHVPISRDKIVYEMAKFYLKH